VNFGAALAALKDGERVARHGWNGRGMWLALWSAGTYDADSELFENCPAARTFALACAGKSADVAPCIVMKAADGALVFGWLASQTDMLADDWEHVSVSERRVRLAAACDYITSANIAAGAAIAMPGAAPDVARAIAIARTHLDTARLFLGEAARLEELAEKVERDRVLNTPEGGGR